MARWHIIRSRRPMSLEQFAGCRGLRTVQSTTKDTFVWLIETAAPSDFLLLGVMYKYILLLSLLLNKLCALIKMLC